MTAHEVVAMRVRRHGHALRERAALVRVEFSLAPMAGLSRRWGAMLERQAGESYALARELLAEGERAAWQPEERQA